LTLTFREKFHSRNLKSLLQEMSLPLWTQVGICEQFFKQELATGTENKLYVFNADIGRVGVGICHDIRFPELAMLYGAKGCSFLLKYLCSLSEYSKL
jgi:predicted amidohydrolase